MLISNSRLLLDSSGAVAIETAIVTPILLLLSFGAYQVSMMVARQSELQSAAAEAATIVMAVRPETNAQLAAIENVVESSAELPPDKVTIRWAYRCGSNPAYTTLRDACDQEQEISTFLRITMTDTYTPQWTRLGVGQPITYRVVRTVQVS